jgi:curli production assembly/transport component CsgF
MTLKLSEVKLGGGGKAAAARAAAFLLMSLTAVPAAAQDLSFTFTNPSFGGNPFNSSHLLAIADAQKPDRPTPSSNLTQTQLFAQQLQARLLSALSAGITTAITGSQPGDSGEFVVGDQKITFENTGTEIKVTIFNQVTGETTTISVPVFNFTNGGSGGPRSASSPEAVLGTMLASTPTATAGATSSTEVPAVTSDHPPL